MDKGIIKKKGTKKLKIPLSANERAGVMLVDALKKFPYTSENEELRYNLKDRVIDLPQLRTMNMKYLAATLILIHRLNINNIQIDDITPEIFENLTKDLITYLYNESKTNVDIMKYNQKQREVIYRYLRAINFYETQKEEERQLLLSTITEQQPEDIKQELVTSIYKLK